MRALLLLFISIPMLLTGCKDQINNADLTEGCILQEIQFAGVNTLTFTTLSGGVIYQLKQEFLDEEGRELLIASFQFEHYPDSTVVRNLLTEIQTFPYMTVHFEDEIPVKVVKYFGGSGVRLIHEIDYVSEDLTVIDLYREASNGDFLYAGKANYHLDEKGNVIRNERFFVDREDTTQLVLFEDLRFTYDEFISPQKELYLPFFTNTNFADVRFFSPNNILNVQGEGVNSSYRYEYNEEGYATRIVQPDLTVVDFSFVNCDSGPEQI